MKSITCVKWTTINVSKMARSRAGGYSCDEDCIKGRGFSASFEFATSPLLMTATSQPFAAYTSTIGALSVSSTGCG